MEKMTPENVITKLINRAFVSVDLPESNNPITQRLLCDLYIANAMASMGTAKKKEITDELKFVHAQALASLPTNQSTELETAFPFHLNAKVSNPRQSFDKEAFIKAIAEKYDISLSELHNLSKTTTKASVAPISFEVVLEKE